jgi:hypothetical protein
MKILTIVLLTLAALTTVGQDKVLSADSDTTYCGRYYRKLEREIGLDPTAKIPGDFYFRFWDGRKVIELRRHNNALTGAVTFFLQQFKNGKEGRLHFKKSKLTDQTTNTIVEFVANYKITDLPSDNQIKGWDNGLDGIIFIVECADKKSYSFKKYWTPMHYQDEIAEARQFVDFADNLNDINELKTLEEEFMDRQPFSRWYYSIGGSMIVQKYGRRKTNFMSQCWYDLHL